MKIHAIPVRVDTWQDEKTGMFIARHPEVLESADTEELAIERLRAVLSCIGESVAPAKVGEEREWIKADTLVAVYCDGEPSKLMLRDFGGINWLAWQRVSDYIARHAPAREGWIDVKERLPKLGEWVWVSIDGVVQRMAAKLEEMSCMGEPSVLAWTWADEESDSAPFDKVSKWQPLPSPPAKEMK